MKVKDLKRKLSSMNDDDEVLCELWTMADVKIYLYGVLGKNYRINPRNILMLAEGLRRYEDGMQNIIKNAYESLYNEVKGGDK